MFSLSVARAVEASPHSTTVMILTTRIMTGAAMKMTTAKGSSSECLQQSRIDRVRHIGPSAFDIAQQYRADAKDVRELLLGQMALVYPRLPQHAAPAVAVSRLYLDDAEAAAEITGAYRLTAAIRATDHGKVRSTVVTTRASFSPIVIYLLGPRPLRRRGFVVLANFPQG